MTLNISIAPRRTLGLAFPPRERGGAPMALAGLVAMALVVMLAGRPAPETPPSAAVRAPVAAPAPVALPSPRAPTRPLMRAAKQVAARYADLRAPTSPPPPKRAPESDTPPSTAPAPVAPARADDPDIRLGNLESTIALVLPGSTVHTRRVAPYLLLMGQDATTAELATLEALATAAFPDDRVLNLARPATLDAETIAIRIVRIPASGPASPHTQQGASEALTQTLDEALVRPRASTLLTSRLTASDGRAAQVSLSAQKPVPATFPGKDGEPSSGLKLQTVDVDLRVKPVRTAGGEIHLSVELVMGQAEANATQTPRHLATYSSEAVLKPGQAMAITGLDADGELTQGSASMEPMQLAILLTPENGSAVPTQDAAGP